MTVDVNTASREELGSLRGIAEELVDAIIEARPFDSIGDLISIAGIGKKSLEHLKEQGLIVGNTRREKVPDVVSAVSDSVGRAEMGIRVPECSVEWGRAKLTGNCDGQSYIISKTIGARHTIRWPKNAGTSWLSIFSLDGKGQIMGDTAQVLHAGETIESYTSAADAHGIAFSCPTAEDATCILEMDR